MKIRMFAFAVMVSAGSGVAIAQPSGDIRGNNFESRNGAGFPGGYSGNWSGNGSGNSNYDRYRANAARNLIEQQLRANGAFINDGSWANGTGQWSGSNTPLNQNYHGPPQGFANSDPASGLPTPPNRKPPQSKPNKERRSSSTGPPSTDGSAIGGNDQRGTVRHANKPGSPSKSGTGAKTKKKS